MKIQRLFLVALFALLGMTQGAWAQVTVTMESTLRIAVQAPQQALLPASLQQQEAGIFCATALQTSPRLYKKEHAHGARVRARCNDEVSSMHRRALVNALSSLRPCMDEAPSMQGLSESAVWSLGQENIKTDKNIRKLIKYLEGNKIFDNLASEIKYKACRKWTQERN